MYLTSCFTFNSKIHEFRNLSNNLMDVAMPSIRHFQKRILRKRKLTKVLIIIYMTSMSLYLISDNLVLKHETIIIFKRNFATGRISLVIY